MRWLGSHAGIDKRASFQDAVARTKLSLESAEEVLIQGSAKVKKSVETNTNQLVSLVNRVLTLGNDFKTAEVRILKNGSFLYKKAGKDKESYKGILVSVNRCPLSRAHISDLRMFQTLA
jgi:hypothetical protein